MTTTQLHALLFPCRTPSDWGRIPPVGRLLDYQPSWRAWLRLTVDVEPDCASPGFLPPATPGAAWHLQAHVCGPEWVAGTGSYPPLVGAELHGLMFRTLVGVGDLEPGREYHWRSHSHLHLWRGLTLEERAYLLPRRSAWYYAQHLAREEVL